MMVTENNELPVPEEQVNASGIEDTTDTAPTAEPAVEKESKNRQDAPADPQAPAPENAADPVVDFSDEEAALAADAPEFDLGDEEPAEENAGGDRVSETGRLFREEQRTIARDFRNAAADEARTDDPRRRGSHQNSLL